MAAWTWAPLAERRRSAKSLIAPGALTVHPRCGASTARPSVFTDGPLSESGRIPSAAPGSSRTPLQEGARPAHRPDVARPTPPDAEEPVRRAARAARPGAAVPVQDGAGRAHCPDVARPASPHAVQSVRR